MGFRAGCRRFLSAALAWLPELLFAYGCLVIAFGYGVVAANRNLFPIPQARNAVAAVEELVSPEFELLLHEVPSDDPAVIIARPEALQPGLLMIAVYDEDHRAAVRIIERTGEIAHEWTPDFFEIWPEPGNIPPDRYPKDINRAYLHGVEILPDGSIVANYEHLSTVRLDPCGGVVWKLDNLGHHTIHVAGDGNIWVPSERIIEDGQVPYRNHVPPLRAWTIEKISPGGEILETIDLIDLLTGNGLQGLLHLSSVGNQNTAVSGDTLHLNDVETLPMELDSPAFDTGDLLISLRNINTILVIDPETRKVKFRATGDFLRQHDPDFVPGGRISVFDNRNLQPSGGPSASRIVEIDVRTGEVSVVLPGDGETRFFTDIMGDHQRLPNGNILVVSSLEGRILEFLPDGTLGWEYQNRIAGDTNGAVFSARVLPPEMDREFFRSVTAGCDLR